MNKETPSTRRLDIQRIQENLDTHILGLRDRIVYEPIVSSTNSLAMKLAREGSEEGVVVLTDDQTAGRGRQGRHWISAPGQTVLLSTVLRPAFSPHLLVMIASLAVVEAIADTTGLTASIKWPNDVLLHEHKIAGILIETSHDHAGHLFAIPGIGVNINGQIAQYTGQDTVTSLQTDLTGLVLANIATTLEEESGHAVSRELFIARLLLHIEERYLVLQQETQESTDMGKRNNQSGAQLIREQWRNHLSTLGKPVQVHQGTKLLSGVAEDVNDQGELLLRSRSGELISVTWGDIEMIRSR